MFKGDAGAAQLEKGAGIAEDTGGLPGYDRSNRRNPADELRRAAQANR